MTQFAIVTCSWRIDRITPRLAFDTTLDSASAIGTNRDLSVIQTLQPSALAGVLPVQHGFGGDYRNFENRTASSPDQPWSRTGSGRGTRAEPFGSAALRGTYGTVLISGYLKYPKIGLPLVE